jgi:hypothetical protein
VAGGTGAASRSARQTANWPINFPLTSASMPRPNCAGRPVTFSSVTTSTRVPPSVSCNVLVTVAAAVPALWLSCPDASITTRRAASSRSTNRPEPRYVRFTGPSLTRTVPANSSPEYVVSVAPGMHGATRSTSSSTRHAWSTGTGTPKLCSSRIGLLSTAR